MTSNFSETPEGYTLDFSASGALIIDTVPPEMDSVIYPPVCNSMSFTVQFSEVIRCSDVDVSDFILTGPEGICQIDSCYSIMSTVFTVGTYSDEFYDDIWTFNLESELILPGEYTLTILPERVMDKCGNLNQQDSVLFTFVCDENYVLIIDTIGSGYVEIDMQEYSEMLIYEEPTAVDMHAFPNEGWVFSHWEDDFTGNQNPTELGIFEFTEITAVFVLEEESFDSVFVNIIGEGSVIIDGELYTEPLYVQYGTSLQFVANSTYYWEFSHWEGSITGTLSPYDLVVDEYEYVTAVFEELEHYTLVVETQGAGNVSVDGSPYTEPLNIFEGETVYLEAEPDPDWIFNVWYGDLSGDNLNEYLIIDGNKTVGAEFVPDVSAIVSNTEDNLALYPNPATDMFSIIGDNIDMIELINSFGQSVLYSAKSNNIDVRNLSKGIYFIKIYSGKVTTIKKLVIIE